MLKEFTVPTGIIKLAIRDEHVTPRTQRVYCSYRDYTSSNKNRSPFLFIAFLADSMFHFKCYHLQHLLLSALTQLSLSLSFIGLVIENALLV